MNNHPCFMSCKPIFDRKRAVHGQLAGSSCLGGVCTLPDDHELMAFNWMVSEGLADIEFLAHDHGLLYIPLPSEAMASQNLELLPPERCILLVKPRVPLENGFIEACQALINNGHKLAAWVEGPCKRLAPVLDLAEVFILDLANMEPLEFARQRKILKEYGKPLMAANLNTWEDFAGATALGVDLFQGMFFGSVEIVKGHEYQANAIAKLELIGILQSDTATFKEVGAIIGKDVYLSYRLISYINHAAVAQGRKVGSIDHAVALLGFEAFKQWAMAALITSLDISPKGEQLAYLSLLRASFLRQLSGLTKNSPLSPEEMFLLGLFSLLDAMMGQDMATLLDPIPMDAKMKEGLTGTGGPIRDWLEFVENVDKNRWDMVSSFLAAQGVEQVKATKAYLAASRWARECFNIGKQAATPTS